MPASTKRDNTMDWWSIVLIVVAVIGLTVFYGLTGAGTSVNCLMRHKSEKSRHLKDDRYVNEEADGHAKECSTEKTSKTPESQRFRGFFMHSFPGVSVGGKGLPTIAVSLGRFFC